MNKQSNISNWLCKQKQNHPSTATSIDNNHISIQANEKESKTINTVKNDDYITNTSSTPKKRKVDLSDQKVHNVLAPSKSSNNIDQTLELFEFSDDIGQFLRPANPSDHIKFKILEKLNIPENNFVYPFSIHIKKGREEKRFLKRSHFEKFKWLVYSKSKSGLFCKFCVFFSNKGGKDNNVELKKLVNEPLNKFAKLLGKDGDLEKHNSNLYHLNALTSATDFLNCYKNPKREIINIVNTSRMKQVLENKERLKPIIESIIFLGRQNIALRGHNDSGHLFGENADKEIEESISPVTNSGNFRALLKYRILSGDTILEKHLKSKTSKATYISPKIQNDIIECCKNYITETIINEVHESNFYSIIFDETTDISHVSQMSLILRYVHNNIVKENFVAFIDCHSYWYSKNTSTSIEESELNEDDNITRNDTLEPKLTGDILGEIVVKILQHLHLNPLNCVGIGTDGCSVMTSTLKGAVKKIQSYAINALHSPCSNHALNLSISRSSSVQAIRNSIGLMKEVIGFFNMSSKRNYVLKTILNGKQRLKSLCETRWVDRHDSVLIFKSSLTFIIEALTKISFWNEQDSSSKAKTLLTAVCSCEFILSLHSLSSLLCVTTCVSKLLQSVNSDISKAADIINDILSNLENKRKNCNEEFKSLFRDAEIQMTELDIELKKPRIVSKQISRSNHETNSIENYYKFSIYIPLLDNIITDLKSRFLNEKYKAISKLPLLLPRFIIKSDTNDTNSLLKTIKEHFTFEDSNMIDELELITELQLWKSRWIRKKNEGECIDCDAIKCIDDCCVCVQRTFNAVANEFSMSWLMIILICAH
ncbi:zinc finger MYM-type protein 1-like isoform X2 [Sipha flava]|uniref:Zinc finger MYM-type protein 1-like isoform X2 n=2 Tax=Sipha flava TaxID=143950 RepID=A0A8B8FWY3_9HEMI|nr:zinc finger MYM-type protein 1-like isoform X2 [Sipha flava]